MLSLLAKTNEGKVSWIKKGSAFTATIPNGVVVNFVLAPGLFGTPLSWQLFTVRDRFENELIQVNAPNFISVLSTTSPSPLVEATNRLFAVISGNSSDDLQHAIDALKKL